MCPYEGDDMQYITPAVILIIILVGMIQKKPVYHSFVSGAGDGLRLLADIFPALVAMLTGVAMLKASGVMDALTELIAPMTQRIGIPAEIMPLLMIRPLSGSGAIGVLSGLLNDVGADSVAGRLASVICGSTETTFYCLAVYFAKTRVRNIGRAIPCAVIGDCAGIAAAVIAVKALGL